MIQKKWWRRVIPMVLGISLVAALAGCGQSASDAPKEEIWQKKDITAEEKVDALMNSMSDADKVGQLILFGMNGTKVNDNVAYMLSEYKMGGIILFDRNMENKEQVSTLIKDLQSTARKSEKVPLFVAVDQEGGLVERMSDHLINVPSAEKLGQGDVNEAAKLALASGKELKELGFNVNFAPVADIGLGDHRSYGITAAEVTPFVKAVGQSYHDAGLIYSLKHFPGIGRTVTDLHKEGNMITASREELDATDLKPYEELIPTVDNNDYMVMVSHATYSGLDPDMPASLSKVIMQDLLRKQLGYKGVIITDDMEMGAVANHYSFGEMSVKSIQAGADIVLIGQEYDHAIEGYNAILKAVRSGEISKERLDDAVRHVLTMKLKNNLTW
ncbi:MAG: glycoside hydrolase family 3 protein [Veillonella sp.]|uniref:glycoside hydrolase family 3 N-terminal domain-containing protein n=1 Tax=Veillonella sp. TaxID=1926307 RepID=UPI0025EECD26|nr:glycoside hydrolase family 3 N-terminal domain-containing protein [Veillonella sp.]MBS4913149.1 glycoside hydrolase family 3 protein [Veillonella sp.]